MEVLAKANLAERMFPNQVGSDSKSMITEESEESTSRKLVLNMLKNQALDRLNKGSNDDASTSTNKEDDFTKDLFIEDEDEETQV